MLANIAIEVRVTLFHGFRFIRLGGTFRLQCSKLALLVLHPLFQLLELLTPTLSSCGFAFDGMTVSSFLRLAMSTSLADRCLLVFWEVLPLLVSVPVVLPLVRTSNGQGCNPHLHVCHVGFVIDEQVHHEAPLFWHHCMTRTSTL